MKDTWDTWPHKTGVPKDELTDDEFETLLHRVAVTGLPPVEAVKVLIALREGARTILQLTHQFDLTPNFIELARQDTLSKARQECMSVLSHYAPRTDANEAVNECIDLIDALKEQLP